VVSLLDLFCQGHLASDAAQRFGAGKAVSFLEARELCLAVGGNHDDFVDALVYAGFEEERDVVDHNCVGILAGGLPGQLRLEACDTGMDDSFKLTQLGSTSEYDGSQRMTIEGAIRIEDGLAELSDNLSPGWFAWFYDVSRKSIGIDDDRTELLEHPGDSALAGGDTACEADQNHWCRA
jgi:hypothetical protein